MFVRSGFVINFMFTENGDHKVSIDIRFFCW